MGECTWWVYANFLLASAEGPTIFHDNSANLYYSSSTQLLSDDDDESVEVDLEGLFSDMHIMYTISVQLVSH